MQNKRYIRTVVVVLALLMGTTRSKAGEVARNYRGTVITKTVEVTNQNARSKKTTVGAHLPRVTHGAGSLASKCQAEASLQGGDNSCTGAGEACLGTISPGSQFGNGNVLQHGG